MNPAAPHNKYDQLEDDGEIIEIPFENGVTHGFVKEDTSGTIGMVPAFNIRLKQKISKEEMSILLMGLVRSSAQAWRTVFQNVASSKCGE